MPKYLYQGIIMIALAALLLLGMSMSGDRPTRTHDRRVTHANGLVLDVPDSLFVEQVDEGFIVSEPGPKDFRMPGEVEVTRVEIDSLTRARGVETRTVGRSLVQYRHETIPQGAGHRHRLTAWIRTPFGCVMLRQFDRRACVDGPRFDLLWKVIAHVSVASHDRGA